MDTNERKELRRLEREVRRIEEAVEIEETKLALARDHGLERNAKFDRAWEIAWSNGHSSGIREVVVYFDELADLLK